MRLVRNGSPAEPSACCEFLDQRLHGGEVVGNGLGAFLTVKEVSKVRRQRGTNTNGLFDCIGELCWVSRCQRDDGPSPIVG